MHARPRAFPFVSLNFRTVSDRLRRKKRKREKKGGLPGSPRTLPFFPCPRLMTSVAAQLSRTADCFSRVRFRGYTGLGCLTSSLTLSHLIVCENLEIYSVSFPPFFFFSSLYDSREMTFVLQFCTFISLSDIISYKISYVKFLIQIFNSFTTRYATEMRSSIQATNKRRIVVLSKGLSKE